MLKQFYFIFLFALSPLVLANDPPQTLIVDDTEYCQAPEPYFQLIQEQAKKTKEALGPAWAKSLDHMATDIAAYQFSCAIQDRIKTVQENLNRSLTEEEVKKTIDATTNEFNSENDEVIRDTYLKLRGEDILYANNNFHITDALRMNTLQLSIHLKNNKRKLPDLIELTAFLNSLSGKCEKYLNIDGVCYLRASTIAHELYLKYPELPVLKLWMVGAQYYGQKWYYHVVPIVPILTKDNKIDWVALDTLVTEANPNDKSETKRIRKPVVIPNWLEYFADKSKYYCPPKLFLSDTTRLSPYCIQHNEFKANEKSVNSYKEHKAFYEATNPENVLDNTH